MATTTNGILTRKNLNSYGPITSWSSNTDKCVIYSEITKPSTIMNCVSTGTVEPTKAVKYGSSNLVNLFDKTNGTDTDNTGGFLSFEFSFPSSNNGAAEILQIVVKTNNLVFTLNNADYFSGNVTWTPSAINVTHARTGDSNSYLPGKSYSEKINLYNYWYYKNISNDYVSYSGSMTFEIYVGPTTTLKPGVGNGTYSYETGTLGGTACRIYKLNATTAAIKTSFSKLQTANGYELSYRLIED